MEKKELLIAYSAALLGFLWYAFLVLRWWRGSKAATKSLPPGPKGLPVVGSLPFLNPELHTYFASLAAIYGPILSLRLGNKMGIVISSPSLAREVLREQDTTFANRDVPATARVITYGGQDIVWSPNGPTWRMLRKVCVREMLSLPSLDAVYGLRRRELRATVRHLRAKAGMPIDVGAQMFLTVLNVITSMLWGGTMEDAVEKRGVVGEEFRELVGEITELLGRPNVSDFFPALARFDLQGVQKKMSRLLERFDQIFAEIIGQRTQVKGEGAEKGGEGNKPKDFLEFMLRLKDEGGDSKTPFTMTHVKALLMDMVVGGTDTTSITSEWVMSHMIHQPDTMRRVQEEVDAVVGKNRVVEEFHLPKLYYLAAVVKEVLRLHPALPLMVPHCPSLSSTVGGYTIPEGARVFINMWAIHRDPSLWEDPMEFRPERFLGMTNKWDYTGNDFSYLPFGSGRRICAGISMAERMVTYSVATLVHSFDWRLPEGMKLDLSEKFGIVLKKAQCLVAIPTPRLSDPNLYD